MKWRRLNATGSIKFSLLTLLLYGQSMTVNAGEWRPVGSYDLWVLFGTVSFEFFVDEEHIRLDGDNIEFVLRVPSLGGGFFLKTLHGNCADGHVGELWSYNYKSESWTEDSVKSIDLDRVKTWEPVTRKVCELSSSSA